MNAIFSGATWPAAYARRRSATLSELGAVMSQLATALEQWENAPPQQEEDRRRRVVAIERAADEVCRFALPLVAYFSTRDKTAVEKVAEELQGYVTVATENAEAIVDKLNEVSDIKRKAEEALTATRKAGKEGKGGAGDWSNPVSITLR